MCVHAYTYANIYKYVHVHYILHIHYDVDRKKIKFLKKIKKNSGFTAGAAQTDVSGTVY